MRVVVHLIDEAVGCFVIDKLLFCRDCILVVSQFLSDFKSEEWTLPSIPQLTLSKSLVFFAAVNLEEHFNHVYLQSRIMFMS
ncbi:hypothetical protein BCEN4_740088 [Burkholderia cenocepacia]|nr:hypothetical protein BCEN4_740088 [Burkholderia cenocepacia]